MLWILAFIILFLLAGGWFVWFKLFQNVQRPPGKTPADLGLAFDTLYIPTKNQRRLHAWWVPAGENPEVAPVLVLVHGWSRNAARMLPYIEAFHPAGFNLLAFDARNHGASDADSYASVVKFAEDILSVLKYLENERSISPSRVGLVGLSIGGSASLLAASWEPRVGAVVTVGAFAHPAEIINRDLKQRGKLLGMLVKPILKLVEMRIGLDMDTIAPENVAKRIKNPVLCIHGTADETVPVDHAHRLGAVLTGKDQEVWLIPGRGHSDCHLETGFWERVTRFLEKVLRESPA